MKILAPAKINLGLEILDKRQDGYHNVDMIMQSVSLYDVLNISITDDLLININFNKEIQCDLKDNIIYKIAKKYFEYTKVVNPGININVEKNIPVCAGLAGGSSDGAATLIGLNEIFNTRLSLDELRKIGESVGSDIPFCITGGTARAAGRGTDLRFIRSNLKYYLVIVKPSVDISTKKAYEISDDLKNKKIKNMDSLEKFLIDNNLKGVCDDMFNRFEEVVHNPEILEIKNKMIDMGAMGVSMSGSGPSVFGVFENEASALECKKEIQKKFFQCFLCVPVEKGAYIADC